VTPWVKRLLVANVLVFFAQQTIPGLTGALILLPAAMLVRPWTMITYMFLHDPGSLWHLFGNMLGLFFFGPRVEQRLGSQHFFALYMISGIFGALLSFLTPYNPILGASGAVLGVTLAYARFWPRDQIYIWGVIPVEVRWLVAGYTLLSLFGIRSGGGGVAHFAHLGGMVGSFLYLQFVSRNAAGVQWKKKVTAAPAPKAMGDWSRVDRSSIHEVNRDEVNRILDKISATGIGSLTPQERMFLSNFVPPDDRKA
jgi:membrane associated rhomboid family serine protease